MLVTRILLQNGGGVTLHKVLTDIPHDITAIVVYALLAGFVGLIWRFGRTHTGP